MSRPVVAIVGRPNVGKSTLFNTLAGDRISIVQDTPGVTRDRIYADVTWLNYNFTIVDTGGIEPESNDIILQSMREQAEIAIETADVILFVTDVRQGLVDADGKVADMLRRSKKPIVLVVNKVDSFEKFMPDVYEFYNLGLGDPQPISAASQLGLGDMLDEVVKHFGENALKEEEDERPRIAIIGKPNVGKSSIINKLLGETRSIQRSSGMAQNMCLLIRRDCAGRIRSRKRLSGTVSSVPYQRSSDAMWQCSSLMQRRELPIRIRRSQVSPMSAARV